MKTLDSNDLANIGRSNACCALDQVDAYDDVQDSIDSHVENVWDTVHELGGTQEQSIEAMGWFESTLAKHAAAHGVRRNDADDGWEQVQA